MSRPARSILIVDTHASRIRGKIREKSQIKVLHAVRGVGYRLLSN